jgi:hypothetical protein
MRGRRTAASDVFGAEQQYLAQLHAQQQAVAQALAAAAQQQLITAATAAAISASVAAYAADQAATAARIQARVNADLAEYQAQLDAQHQYFVQRTAEIIAYMTAYEAYVKSLPPIQAPTLGSTTAVLPTTTALLPGGQDLINDTTATGSLTTITTATASDSLGAQNAAGASAAAIGMTAADVASNPPPDDNCGDNSNDYGPTYKGLRDEGVKDSHHVIQDAAVRDLPGYSHMTPPP